MIQIAFLSGYDDFEYTRSAIENQVIAYLLKPISLAEITRELKEIHKKMEKRQNQLQPPPLPVSRQLAVASLLLDQFADYPEEQSPAMLLQDCGMQVPSPCSFLVLVSGSRITQPQSARIVDTVLEKYYQSCSFVSGGHIFSLVLDPDGFRNLDHMLNELSYTCRKQIHSGVSIGVSGVFRDLRSCFRAVQEAAGALPWPAAAESSTPRT
ncbi:MAG: hypothetical protein IJ106_01315 [Parasporobacterium sp.]|nr:hypothetical protein [Parasporobacterium sp.]